MTMAVCDAESKFWRQKIQRFMEVRDANKDGFLERADIKPVVQRYKELGASEEQLKKISNSLGKAFDQVGIVDDSIALTYDEFASRFAKLLKTFKGKDESMFEVVDSDGDGKISFKEWVDFYKCQGIDPAHARASFDAMDANGDGVVSMEEFIAYYTEFMLSTEDTLNSSILYGPL